MVLLIKVVVAVWIHWRILDQQGLSVLWESYIEQPDSMPAPVFSLLGLIYLALAPRVRATYVLTSLALLALSYDAVLNSYRQWTWYGPYQTWPILEVGVQAGVLLLFFYLPFRFIFGLPSRRYYGMVRDTASSNP